MSAQLDSILARSRAPGRFVERRRFTLSRDKAVEKLREFSLRRPEQYILELVQAAVFAGARWIAIDVSPERLFFAWVGGRHYTDHQLGDVFDYLFADRAAAETRHVVQLAVALNALLQRKPEVLRIESGDGTSGGTVRMDLDKTGKGHLGQPEEAFQGTYLVAEFATSWFSRFQGEQFTTEQSLVESRCLYTPVPILLNYRAPFGYRAHRQIKLYGQPSQVSFDDADRRGALTLAEDRDEGVRIVIGGVWITTRDVPELGGLAQGGGSQLKVSGVICDDRLRKTADQSDVVEDGRWIDMLHDVQPHATRLFLQRNPRYSPPALPRRVAEAVRPEGGAAPARRGPEPEPLPDLLDQVGPRPRLVLEDLQGLAEGTPAFWCTAAAAQELGSAGAPDRFPFRLLVLSPGQAVTLAEQAPGLSLGPITSPADAEFVTRIMARQADTREVSLRVGPEQGLDGTGQLVLRLHRVGPTPAWGADDGTDVPVVARIGRTVPWCGGLPLGLPHVSVVLELERGRFDPTEGTVVLVDLVRRHAWRLLEGVHAPHAAALSAPERALAVALLAMAAVPHVHQQDDGPALDVILPRSWGASAHALRGLPLADLADGGSLSFDRFLSLLGHTGRSGVASLARDEDLDLLHPLAQRLGAGHLLGPQPHHEAAYAIARVGPGTAGRWVHWEGLPTPQVQAVLWVGQDLAPSFDQPGWRTLPPPCAAVGLAVRQEGTLSEVELGAGLRLLREQLAPIVREDLWEPRFDEALPEPERSRRVESARQLGRLALIALTATTGEAGGRVLPRSDGARWRTLSSLDPAPGVAPARVALRNGVRVVEADTVLLTWDEVAALRHAGLRPVPRFDDSPEVLHSLLVDPGEAEPGQAAPMPGNGGWLLRQRLQVPGLDGWLGLRAPYDPTSVVLLQQSGALVALTHVDRHVPCHGMAWALGATDTLSRVQRDLLELARLRLYQALCERLEEESDAAWREVAEPYAVDFAVHSWRAAAGAPVEGTAGRLLTALRLTDAEGRSLGSLRQWLEQPVDRRPTPVGHAALYQAVQRGDSGRVQRKSGDVAATLAELERRVARVLQLSAQIPDLRIFLHEWEGKRDGDAVRLRDEGSSFGVVSMDLNVHHPLVYTALAEPGDAREMLLLDIVRVGAGVAREEGATVDLLAVHQLLAAQRL